MVKIDGRAGGRNLFCMTKFYGFFLGWFEGAETMICLSTGLIEFEKINWILQVINWWLLQMFVAKIGTCCVANFCFFWPNKMKTGYFNGKTGKIAKTKQPIFDLKVVNFWHFVGNSQLLTDNSHIVTWNCLFLWQIPFLAFRHFFLEIGYYCNATKLLHFLHQISYPIKNSIFFTPSPYLVCINFCCHSLLVTFFSVPFSALFCHLSEE